MAIDQISSFMHSISALESGHNYEARGPNTGTYGRALGRYQIMSAFYPAWAREAGVDPNDLSPAAQDRVAKHKMTQYYNKYKSWDLVAVAWFAGPGRADKARRSGVASVGGIKDMLGTSVSSYVSKVVSGMAEAGSGTERTAERGLMRQPGNPTRPSTERSVERGLMRQPGNPTAPPRQGASFVAPIEAAPGTTLTPEQEQRRGDQITQDALGSILDTISEAARGNGGQVLDLKNLFGMPPSVPEQQPSVVEGLPGVTGDGPAQAPQQPVNPTQADAALAAPPKHDGFERLQDHAKAGTQRLMGQFPGLRFTSGYRDPKRNAAAGGVKNSKHLTGEASDFVGSEEEMQAAAVWAKSQGAKVLVHDSGSGRHLHIEWA